MAASTAVHSNAFNFLGALQNGVDPRTGQYSVSIELPALKTNSLSGPSIPLVLRFNPLQLSDHGFGYGWALQLTQYDVSTQIISLHTGETYKVDSWDPDSSRAIISEQRLDTFHFYDEGNGTYRVMHVSGEMEILVDQGSVAVPEAYYSAEGQKIVLSYTVFEERPLLNTIIDANDLLVLSVTRESGDSFIHIDVYPFSAEGGKPVARFSMELTGDEQWVTQIHLPSEDKALWEFTYRRVFDCLCIESVSSPTGSKEEIIYDTQGHEHPAPGSQQIPRVSKHRVLPLFEQPAIEHHYTYSTENFLGYGAGDFDWDDDGQDNLYKVLTDYTYNSTQSLIVDGNAVRTQTRTFNRYHLLTLDVSKQNGHVYRIITEYAINMNQPFHQQRAYCQLPIKSTQTWYLEEDINQLRSISASSTYNNRGLLTSHTYDTGVVEYYTYYSPEGEATEDYFCPADAEGFVRYMRDKIVIPAGGTLEVLPPKLLTRYSYAPLPSLAYDRVDTFIYACEETLLELHDNQPSELQKSRTSYYDDPSDPFLHGRLKNTTITVKTTTLSTEYTYQLVDDPSLLEINKSDTTSVVDQAPLTLSLISQISVFDGNPRSTKEGSIVQTYRYDSLGRVLQESTAPGTDVEASKYYTYALSVDGSQSKCVVTNVDGIETHTYFDGLNRTVRKSTLDPTHRGRAEEIQTYLAQFDAWGNLVKESTYDWLDDKEHIFNRSFNYDNWGQQYSVTGPSGACVVDVNDPIGIHDGSSAVKHPTLTHYLQSSEDPKLISDLTVTILNSFGKPLWTKSLNASRQLLAIKSFSYDGFGRCVASIDESGRMTRYSYDSRSRLLTSTQPDFTLVTNTYAPHATQGLHSSVTVKPNNHSQPELLVGKQQFDGFGRLTSLTTGTLTEQYDYIDGQAQVSRLTRASGKWIDYEYDLRLTTSPKKVLPKDEALCTFEYNALNASMTGAFNAEGSTDYEYNSQRQLIKETRKNSSDHELITHYTYSTNGLALSKTDSTGMIKRYTYDAYARLATVQQYDSDETRGLSVVFNYNSFGQLSLITTTDSAARTTLSVDIDYDDHGREILRTQTLNTEPPRILSQRWLPNNLLHTRELKVAGVSQLLERFEYDAKGRLCKHTYTGPALPKDRYGNEITRQIFRFDALDNIKRCLSTFADGQSDLALFTYSIDDSCRLLSVSHDHTNYTAYRAFDYDADGNMLNDEQGQGLIYDTQGRLLRVDAAEDGHTVCQYRYDAHNQLISTQVGTQTETLRFYEGNRLSLAVHEGISTHLLTLNGQPIGQQQSGDENKTLVLLTDASHTVVGECLQNQLLTAAYTAYGERSSEQALHSMVAFNGEVLDEASGWYLLGKGYRAYNPLLMRFHSPDSMSPFGAGGLNPYGYCLGNPVALRDPSGHAGTGRNRRPERATPTRSPGVLDWLGVIIGIQLLVLAVVATAFFPPAAAAASAAATFVSTAVVGLSTAVGASATAASALGMAAYIGAYTVTYAVASMFPLAGWVDKAFFSLDAALTAVEAAAIVTKNPQVLGIVELAGWLPLPLGWAAGAFTGSAKASISASRKGMYRPEGPHVSTYNYLPNGDDSLDDIDFSLFGNKTPAPKLAPRPVPTPPPAPTNLTGADQLFENIAPQSETIIQAKTTKAYPVVKPSNRVFTSQAGVSWFAHMSSTRT